MKYTIKSASSFAVLGLDGAMLNSLKKDGTEYLWQGDPAYWGNQAPVCFPIVGVLPNGEGTAFGKKCVMKRHGVARISPFEVAEQHANSITFVQRASEETKKVGFKMIEEELGRIPKEKVREIARQNIEDIKNSNRRDFRF